jgi:hypothetical protein
MERTDLTWRKSSYSSNGGGNCIETATVPGAVLVRDSKNPDGPQLSVSLATWRAFTASVKSA